MDKTAIIILNFNNYEDTINCIESVEKYNSAPIKLIIVDNASTRSDALPSLENYLSHKFDNDFRKFSDLISDGTAEELVLPYCSLIASDINDGYAKGNNKGLRLSLLDNTIKNILILNNDILFVEDIIPSLIGLLDSIPNVGIVSPVLYKKGLKSIDFNCARKDMPIVDAILNRLFTRFLRYINYNDKLYILKNKNMASEIVEIELPSGSCMLLRKDLFKEISLFDPNTFLYYEENILYRKMQQKHLHNYLCTSLKCIHLGASSTSKSPSMLIVDAGIHSGNYYYENYYPCSRTTVRLYKMSNIFHRFCVKTHKLLTGKK
mgnify:CR=1 FL=1